MKATIFALGITGTLIAAGCEDTSSIYVDSFTCNEEVYAAIEGAVSDLNDGLGEERYLDFGGYTTDRRKSSVNIISCGAGDPDGEDGYRVCRTVKRGAYAPDIKCWPDAIKSDDPHQFEKAIKHELGHFMGVVQHSDDPNDIMCHDYNGVWEYSENDLERIRSASW